MMPLVSAIFNSLLMVVLPVADALINDRSPATLLLMYFAESLVLLVLDPLRVRLHRAWTDANGHYLSADRTGDPIETMRAEATTDPNCFLSGLAWMSTVLAGAQLVFVVLLVFVLEVCGPVRMDEIRHATLYAVSAQLALFGFDLVTLRRWSFPELQKSVSGSLKRALATQFGLLLGAPLTLSRSPWAVPGTLLVFRVLVDLAFEISMFFDTRDPPDVKRARAEAQRWLSSPRKEA